MRSHVQRYWCPKQGCAESEYEDATAYTAGPGLPRRLAVADGATESSFARLWATLLAGAYVDGELSPESLVEQLQPLQQRWSVEVAAKPLSWYASEKARNGAFAALAGLTLCPNGTWQAVAVGDCCVLHLRDGLLLRSFPLEHAAAFDNRPKLLSSNPERNQGLRESIRATCGHWQPGDSFLLMSDALAAYVLRRVVGGGDPAGVVLPFRRPHVFRRWVEARRADRSLRNDDVSLLRVRVT